MFLSILILITALCLSGVAAFYSIVGLTAIFAAAVVPIIIMGGILEVAKLVVTVWLHEYWPQVKRSMKIYLTTAVVVLMFITSMGIFGFLSKAHIEQTAKSNESVAEVQQIETELVRLQATIDRSEDKIQKAQTVGTGADQNIQSQIDREQDRINTAYDRVQPAIDTTNQQLDRNVELYTGQISTVDRKLNELATASNIDTNNEDAVKRLQALVGTRPDGAYGGGTARAVKAYKDDLESQKAELFSKIEELKQDAQEEIRRLRIRAEQEIDDSNRLITRLRNQLGQDTGADIETIIAEENAKIKSANAEIDTLTEQKYELEAEYRALEAEVGPVKFIAEMIYGEADKNLLEEAVRWVIILIVVVFDPLAVMMLLAATESIAWTRNEKQARQTTISNNESDSEPRPEPDPDGTAVTDAGEKPPGESTGDSDQTDGARDPGSEAAARATQDDYIAQEIVYPEPEEFDPREFEDEQIQEVVETTQEETDPTAQDSIVVVEEETIDSKDINAEKIAKKVWKTQNPNDTLKRQEAMLEKGVIDELPWESLAARIDEEEVGNVDFGTKFPTDPQRGDTYIRVDYLPTKLYKFNGSKWIEVDKNISDSFAYNDGYIEHLIAKIGNGEYDPELLNDNERDQIEERLKNQDI